MERELSVLLVEDDTQLCSEIVAYVETLDDIRLIGVTDNAVKAVEYIREYMPDAVILDLELHHGGGNGIQVLEAVRELTLTVCPFFLVTTNNTSSVVYEAARNLGADFIMSKHEEKYTSKSAVDFIRIMKSVLLGKEKHLGDAAAAIETPERDKKRYINRIMSELNRIGISPKVVGYQYLMDAIYLVMKKPVSNLSTIIGKKYQKTEASVERAMQNAINRAWKISDINDLLENYTAKISSEKGVPTITEFVCYYAEKIKNNY